MSFERDIDDIKKHLDYARDYVEDAANEFVSKEGEYLNIIATLNNETVTLREVNDDLAEENAALKQRVAEYEMHTMELVAENESFKAEVYRYKNKMYISGVDF